MTLFALTEFWNEFYAAGGFWVGVVGTVVGVAGFWIAIVQIRATRKAAEAARDAAEKTLAESKEAYERFVGTFASRLLSELERAVNANDWGSAAVRVQDLAELIAALPGGAGDDGEAEFVNGLRDLAADFVSLAQKQAAGLPPRAAKKWNPIRLLLHERLDRLRKPFRR